LSGSIDQDAAERTAAEPHTCTWLRMNGLFLMTLTSPLEDGQQVPAPPWMQEKLRDQLRRRINSDLPALAGRNRSHEKYRHGIQKLGFESTYA
jgi:hypothetical protein